MLIATFLSALAVTAPSPDRFACEIGPSLGSGSSDEGKIDSITSLNFGCRYEVLNLWGVGLSPVLGLDRQLWTVNDNAASTKTISSYETQDFNFGFRLDTALGGRTKIFYGLLSGQGKGTLNTTQSTDQSSLSSSYSNLKNNFLQHSFGASYGITEKLSVSLAWQRQTSNQSWSLDSGDILLQNVDEENHLTLTDGVTALLGGPEPRSKNQSTTNLIQIGLSLSFGG